MSAQEFKVGQQVKDGDYDRLPVGAKAGTLEKWSEHEWRDLSGIPLFQKPHATRVLVHLPDAAEPEDKDDLYVEPDDSERYYLTCDGISGLPCKEHGTDCQGSRAEGADDVEPEPLKEGDWVQVWAQVRRADYEAEVHKLQVFTSRNGGEDLGFVADDQGVIVRPDAGQMPPWVKPAQCTSLYEYEEGKYVRCCRANGHANPDHQGYGKGWLAESARLADGGAS